MGVPTWMYMPYSVHAFPAGSCEGTEAYSAEEQCRVQSQHFTNWYISDWVYARGTVIFLCVGIALFALVHRLSILQASKGRKGNRFTAAARFLASRHVRLGSWSISYGNAAILSIISLYFLLMTVGPTPYYWPEVGWASSPPIATRTGYLALGPLPFLVTLASKRNPIGYIAGVSHERLQIFHRYIAHLCLILGLIHTFAFIRYGVQAGTNHLDWTTNQFFWTGVGMLVPQVWLSVMSLGFVRNRAYEFFKQSHRAVAIVFVVFFWLHCGATQTSWHYFWALLAVYGSAVVWRVATMAINRFKLRGKRATFRVVGDQLLEITVKNSEMKWRAGQHYFFRFTSLNAFDSLQAHPFTPLSVPTDQSTDLVAVAKIHRGQIKHLSELAHWKKGFSTQVWLDGPYGTTLDVAGRFDRVLLLGGGSGLSYTVSAAAELSKSSRASLHFVAACKQHSDLELYLSHLASVDKSRLQVSSHVTTERLEKDLELNNSRSDDHSDKESSIGAPANSNRPDLRALIRQEIESHSKLAVIACGPASFMADVQDEVAKVQLEILKGSGKEVYLRSEMYSW